MATTSIVRAESVQETADRLNRRWINLTKRSAYLKAAGETRAAARLYRRAQRAFSLWCDVCLALPAPTLRPVPEELVYHEETDTFSVEPKPSPSPELYVTTWTPPTAKTPSLATRRLTTYGADY